MENCNETTGLLCDTQDFVINNEEVLLQQHTVYNIPNVDTAEDRPIEKPIGIPISTTFQTIRVGQLLDAQIINKTYYEEDQQKKVNLPHSLSFLAKNEEIEQNGLLKSADLKISFTVAKTVHIKNKENISFRITEQKLPFNLRTKIDFIYNEPSASDNIVNQSATSEEIVYSVVIPIYKGIESISLPLFDDVHTKGERLLHHTVVIDSLDGNLLSQSYYIRLLIHNGFKDIKIVSNTTNNIDVLRISEMFQNSKEFVVKSAVSVKESIAKKFTKEKKQEESQPSPPLYPQIMASNQFGSIPTDNNPMNPLIGQFQKVDVNNYATPIAFPPNCQIIYCISPQQPVSN